MAVIDQGARLQRYGTDALRAEAVQWVQRLDSDRVSAADIEALRAWRARSPAHEASFAEARRLWASFAAAASQMRAEGELQPKVALSPQPVLTRRLALGGLAAAAASAAVVYAGSTPSLSLWPSIAELGADYRTRTGEQRRLALADDVLMHLNTQTSIALRPAADADRIELIAGEAEFSANHRSARELIVLASGGEVAANQARFDIRHSSSDVCVSCVSGSVAVRSHAKTAQLGPGQQVRYDSRGLGAVEVVSVELVTAWQDGVLIFRKTPLSEVVGEINRYRPGRVILVDRKLAGLPVSGRFRIDHIGEIFLRLEQAFGIASRSLPAGVVLLG